MLSVDAPVVCALFDFGFAVVLVVKDVAAAGAWDVTVWSVSSELTKVFELMMKVDDNETYSNLLLFLLCHRVNCSLKFFADTSSSNTNSRIPS